jgi:hypothetical protein
LLPLLMRLALGVHHQLVRFFLGLEESFFLMGFGVALRVAGEALCLFFSATDCLGRDPLPVRDPNGEDNAASDKRSGSGYDEIDEYRQHAVSFLRTHAWGL